jgi:hypothetical protein
MYYYIPVRFILVSAPGTIIEMKFTTIFKTSVMTDDPGGEVTERS